jgi:hypothetical protein
LFSDLARSLVGTPRRAAVIGLGSDTAAVAVRPAQLSTPARSAANPRLFSEPARLRAPSPLVRGFHANPRMPLWRDRARSCNLCSG